MIDFEALEQAFAPVEDVGKQEITLEIEGQTVVLQPLLPGEEAAAQGYARDWLDPRTDDKGMVPKHIQQEYFHILRVEILCFAVAEVNGLDLRKVDYVATGQKTESGRPVRVQKHVAVRELITKKRPWSRHMFEVAFGQYNELMERIERDSGDLLQYEPSDLKTEHERRKRALAEIEAEMERRAKGDLNLMAAQVEAIKQLDTAAQAARRPSTQAEDSIPTPEPEPEPEPEAPVAPPPPPEPEWADFDEMPSASDLQDRFPDPEDEEPVVSRRTEPRQSAIPRQPPPPMAHPPQPELEPEPLHDVMDSFQDPDEEGVLEAEQARIQAARRRMAAERRANQEVPAVRRPKPPHMRGTRPADAVSLDAKPAGDVDGIEAYRMPTQELSRRGREHKPTEPVTADPTSGGPTNPNFRPPPKGG